MDQSSKARAAGAPLSLEALLDEENREVLASLNRPRSNSPISSYTRNVTPPPYRSMLDIDSPAPRHGSIAGIGVGITSPRDQRKPSTRLDPANPSTWTSPHKTSAPSTPHSTTESLPDIQKGLPKIQVDSKPNFEQEYNFDMASMPSSVGTATKTAQGTRPRNNSGNAMSQALRGELENKHSSSKERGQPQARSSPAGRSTAAPSNPALLSPVQPGRKPRTSSGSMSDGHRRRLSNKSNKSSSFSTTDDAEYIPTRVMADGEEDEDAVVESSEDEEQDSSSDEGSPEDDRGRKRETSEDQAHAKDKPPADASRNKLAPQSLGVKSLIEPERSPSRPHQKSNEVHPPSNFGRSGPTAADFAGEDDVEADIQKAKNLGLNISPLDDSIQDRCVRMVIRGDWSRIQGEFENNNTSPRLYLVCTDLSMEATYAMEWTVGTMLRDGDTLLAIHAIEDENAPKESEGNAQVMAESAKAATDASDTMEMLTRQTTDLEKTPLRKQTKFVPAIEAPTLTGSMNLKTVSKKEKERFAAIDEITENFLKLVRKTPLQVRCMIEVIHCKSPKHLILNAIDELEPTLCVVGTRGRSSLKGVLLGSFSNYLVTKSSVPVMVARKRLKKPHHAKVNSSSIRLSNNLTSTGSARKRGSLTSARID